MTNPHETSRHWTPESNRTGSVDPVQVEPADSDAITFEGVFRKELEDLKKRRDIEGNDPWEGGQVPETGPKLEPLRALRRQAFDNNLFGLALSGGGIRSATFCLGVLQALARAKLLHRVDYLSTVSGGGYIGAWLAAWLKREGNVKNVEKQLHPSHRTQASAERREVAPNRVLDDEPEAVRHLRAYSNYLAPRPGLFSADGWVLIAIYLRNFLLNQLVLCSALLALLFAAFLIVMLFGAVPSSPQDNGGWPLLKPGDPDSLTHLTTAPWGLLAVVGALSFVLLLFACITIDQGLREIRATAWGKSPEVRMSSGKLHWAILVPLLVTSVGLSFLALYLPEPRSFGERFRQALCVTAAYVLVHGILFYGKKFREAMDHLTRSQWKKAFHDFYWFISALVAPGVVGLLTYLAVRRLLEVTRWPDGVPSRMFSAPLLVTFGPPLVLGGVVLIGFLQVGLVGRLQEEEDHREWRSSLAGWLMMYAAGWAALFGAVVYGPYLVLLGLEHFPSLSGSLVAGWVAAVAAGLWAASNPATGTLADARTVLGRLRDLLARLAPGLFLVGMFVFGAWFTQRLGRVLYQYVTGSEPCPFDRAESYLAYLTLSAPPTSSHNNISWEAMLLVLAGAAGFAAILAWGFGRVVDINIFSLNALYANRLIRCYLGASRPQRVSQSDPQSRRSDRPAGAPTNSKPPVRNPNLITMFDPLDDLRLWELAYEPLASGESAGEKERYDGPTLIINTALNLVRGRELAWQERKAESFVLTARFCGSGATNYRRTNEFAGGVWLGEAISISGAAVSPNMGYHSSPSVAAMLTAFNARLGAWVGNPNKHTWKDRGPQLGLLYLLYEMFGRTDECSNYVYLSDGGHFDNTGVYELIRRRCRFIVACDAGADGDFGLEDLGNLVRKVRIDFGVRIDIDVSNLKRRPDRWALAHVAVGKIRYGDVDGKVDSDPGKATEREEDPNFNENSTDGVLVYIKPTLTGDEPADILNYAGEHRSFPHESTLNQFFTESQFESYRALGFHSVKETLGGVVRELGGDKAQFTNVRFFTEVYGKLYPPPPDSTLGFLAANREFMAIHKALRELPELAGLSLQIYPDLQRQRLADPLPGPDATKKRIERHMVAEMLTVLENAWFGLRLDQHLHHPVHACWCNVCKNWLKSPIFMEHYQALHSEFSHELHLLVRQMQKELQSEGEAALRNGETEHGGNR